MSIVTESAEKRVQLWDVGWRTYETLRASPDNRNVRMTYDRGSLELMSPSNLHERLAILIGRLIEAWTEEFGIPMQSGRCTTLKREDLQRGCEPDNCYYFKNEPAVRERDDLDLTIAPPPDLVIEVDLSSNSTTKMAIYAAFGVPELWRCDGETLSIYELQADGGYSECARSPTLPKLPPEQIMRFLSTRHETDETSWIRSFRQWVRESVIPGIEGRQQDEG